MPTWYDAGSPHTKERITWTEKKSKQACGSSWKASGRIPIAKGFKEAGIKIPIIPDGGFTTPELAEQALEDGVCDYIGLGRPAIADPLWAVKLAEGRPEDITPCIRCTRGCVGTMETFNAAVGLRCSVNPRCNMAGIRDVNPIDRVKRVGIVGGGPAGMEAARQGTVGVIALQDL